MWLQRTTENCKRKNNNKTLTEHKIVVFLTGKVLYIRSHRILEVTVQLCMLFIHHIISIWCHFIQPAGYLFRIFLFLYCEILFLLLKKQKKGILWNKTGHKGCLHSLFLCWLIQKILSQNIKHSYYFPLLSLYANSVPCPWPLGTMAQHQELCMSFCQSVMLTYHNIRIECSSGFAEFVHLP